MSFAASGWDIVVRKEGDTEDFRVRRGLKSKLGHVSEVDGGRVIDGFEGSSGVEMACGLRMSMPVLGQAIAFRRFESTWLFLTDLPLPPLTLELAGGPSSQTARVEKDWN